jgi:hypothetical protein
MTPKLARADDLRKALEDRIPSPFVGRYDMLSEYRHWLQKHGIPAETTDGWPSEDAYDRSNVAAFLVDFQRDSH